MHDPILNIAIEAAKQAGQIIVRAMDRLDKIKIAEKNPNDFVTDIDQKAERAIITTIQKAYPHHTILSEESGEHLGEDADYQWIIDPLDGTRNFIHGFPHFAVSIAVMHKNKLEYGVIYDPARQECFTAARGKGAQLNDRRIRVASRKELHHCLLGTGFAYRHRDKEAALPAQCLQAIMPICGDIRRAGAAALDLAYVACGRLDGFWEWGLRIWDIAAGVLLVKEAGGLVTDPLGQEDYLQSGHVVAANPAVLKQMVKVFKCK